MMEGWQAGMFLQAQAEIVNVEGMKAENEMRKSQGLPPKYSETDFNNSAGAIEQIAMELRQS